MGHVATLYKCMCKTGGLYLPAFALWRPLGEHLQQCVSQFTMEEKVQQCVCVCALISVSVWGKLVLKRMKCRKQLSESPA